MVLEAASAKQSGQCGGNCVRAFSLRWLGVHPREGPSVLFLCDVEALSCEVFLKLRCEIRNGLNGVSCAAQKQCPFFLGILVL